MANEITVAAFLAATIVLPISPAQFYGGAGEDGFTGTGKQSEILLQADAIALRSSQKTVIRLSRRRDPALQLIVPFVSVAAGDINLAAPPDRRFWLFSVRLAVVLHGFLWIHKIRTHRTAGAWRAQTSTTGA